MRKLIEYKDVVKKEKKRLMKKEKLEEDGSVASNKEEERQRKHSSGGILSAVVGFFSANEPVNKPGIGMKESDEADDYSKFINVYNRER